ncbi:hypothetical protein OK348_17515 [Flavobacterium sp. MXW15]|uniref:Protein sip-5 n=1 Tax=Xanthomonas chitinilytica TaxID=2989819 RepID=A0ABT3K0N1_9XANT|nr:protein sip-5 [Xanthomonas sp. H13-6]MCW4456579.1 hypothetical protein [Flavobacterium sp. MXW15]MCW4474281.1 protein sip-5 [Xanthomonas sp. H13-6]
MNFGTLRRRVERAERLVQGRADDTEREWGTLKRVWREGWTPMRIIVAGLAGGFLAGKFEPAGQFNGARWLQMIGSVSNLLATAQAAFVAETAPRAAEEEAQAAPERAAAEPAPAPASTGTGQGRSSSTPPRAAEAATELSEP